MHALILAVGNHDFTSTVLAQLCELTNCALQTADNSCEALQLIQAQQPDVVIVQGQLADGPGVELCHRIKAQPKLAWIYCLLLQTETPVIKDNALDEARVASFLEQGADVVQNQGLTARLLLAQVRVGLRIVYNHRSLMRTNDLLTSIALSDPLTELNNRRALDGDLPRQIQNARSRGLPLSLIMLDVDLFKSINDRYGHLAGDRALQLLANRLQNNLRFHDTLFRYGGEEFVIILSNTEIEEAVLVGKRLCHLVSAQPFAIDSQINLRITISIGTAYLQENDNAQGLDLLNRADQNLLRAKAQGRNRVVSCLQAATPPAPTSNVSLNS
ncbi:diguanylate cyclase [Leptolyngbya sp. FACHB-261]|uniref:GGDEF domain-containing response regulator n=1 Tax=Leptolyngbya sp. FACHB-261 TaxID=2692806 RepID=UPI001681FE42|nr:diguanylate cyclase [Leptolyngbya sp. FACHB-261]MBD2103606.1 diguanylate cyclase [Leptolyngbya sp. FACHB-261]